MIKFGLAAAAGFAAILSAGVAQAASDLPDAQLNKASVSMAACDAGPHYVQDNASSIVSQLKAAGISANFVDQSSGCVEAFVTNSSGGQSIRYFAPYTLQPVNSL